MPTQKILTAFRKYQKTSTNKRGAYMKAFELKMIYRTTKTENPETTSLLVKKVLRKVRST